MKELKKAIKNLTAIQTRMALILLQVNGKECAMEFIRGVSNREPKQQKLFTERG